MDNNFSALFKRLIVDNPYFLHGVEIARANSTGDLWVIGGFVYRHLAAELFHSKVFPSDIDFVASGPKPKKLHIPRGWDVNLNHYGTPKFKYSSQRNRYSIDVSSMIGWDSIVRRNLQPTIENVLTGTPLTIQSIAYNVETEEIVGDIGINAILCKEVRVNNQIQADYYSMSRNISLGEFVKKKASSVGFTPIFD